MVEELERAAVRFPQVTTRLLTCTLAESAKRFGLAHRTPCALSSPPAAEDTTHITTSTHAGSAKPPRSHPSSLQKASDTPETRRGPGRNLAETWQKSSGEKGTYFCQLSASSEPPRSRPSSAQTPTNTDMAVIGASKSARLRTPAQLLVHWRLSYAPSACTFLPPPSKAQRKATIMALAPLARDTTATIPVARPPLRPSHSRSTCWLNRP